MSFETEVLVLAFITVFPIFFGIFFAIKEKPDKWALIAGFQILAIWSIIPLMFWFKLLEIYSIWPY